MSDFKAKMLQIRSRLRLRPDPAGGTNSAPPEPLAGFKGPTCKGLVAAAYCQVYGVIHFTSPAGCTPGSAPGPVTSMGKLYLYLFYFKGEGGWGKERV